MKEFETLQKALPLLRKHPGLSAASIAIFETLTPEKVSGYKNQADHCRWSLHCGGWCSGLLFTHLFDMGEVDFFNHLQHEIHSGETNYHNCLRGCSHD